MVLPPTGCNEEMGNLFKIETDEVVYKWGPPRGKETEPVTTTTEIQGRLSIRKRRRNLSFEGTWRSSVPENIAGDTDLTYGPRIFEQTDYPIFQKSKTENHIKITHRYPTIRRDLIVEEKGKLVHGNVNFRSQIGRCEF